MAISVTTAPGYDSSAAEIPVQATDSTPAGAVVPKEVYGTNTVAPVAANTTYTIAHTLGRTPDVWTFSKDNNIAYGVSADATNIKYLLATTATATFTVHYSAAIK